MVFFSETGISARVKATNAAEEVKTSVGMDREVAETAHSLPPGDARTADKQMNYTFGDRVKKLVNASAIDKSEKDAILSLGRITYKELREAHQKCSGEPDVGSLMHYMSDLTPVFRVYDREGLAKAAKTDEFKALMSRLRAEEKEREYRTLLKRGHDAGAHVDGIGSYAFLAGRGQAGSAGQAAKEVKHQLTTIVNILITVVSAGYAVWYWSGSSMGLSRDAGAAGNMGVRVLLSLFAAVLVLVAEIVVFGGYLRKVDDARTKEHALVEDRSVVQTIVIKGKGATASSGPTRDRASIGKKRKRKGPADGEEARASDS